MNYLKLRRQAMRRLTALAGFAVAAILAVSIGSAALAQSGTGAGQATIQDGDTLGSLVDQYQLTGSTLRSFFNENTNLQLRPGQTIAFPEGVTVNQGGPGRATRTENAPAESTSPAVTESTGTVNPTGTANPARTASPAGSVRPSGAPSVTQAVTGTVGGAATRTSPTQSVTRMVGEQGGATIPLGETGDPGTVGGVGATNTTPTIIGTPTWEIHTPTPETSGSVGASGTRTPSAENSAATTSGSTLAGTTTPGADAQTPSVAVTSAVPSAATGTATLLATPASTGNGSAGSANGSYTTQLGDSLGTILGWMGFPVNGSSAGGTGSGSALTDAQLQDFVDLNRDLQFQSGQTINLPGGIPQTGQATSALESTATMQASPTAQATATAGDGAGGAAGAEGSAGAGGTADSGTYIVQPGDTLQSIAARYGISVTQLLELNPNLLPSGQTMNVPSGAIPATGAQGQGAAGGSAAPGTSQTLPENAGRFVNKQGCPDVGRGSGVYVAQGGESLQSIANRFGVTLQQVLDRNPGIQSVGAGQVIILPGVEAPGLWNMSRCEHWGPTAVPSQ